MLGSKRCAAEARAGLFGALLALGTLAGAAPLAAQPAPQQRAAPQPAAQPPAAQPPAAPQPAAQQQDQAPARHLSPRIEREPRAMAILQGMCDRLSAARSLAFTAVATYESPARTGHPLAYATAFQVLLQRPDRLRVLMPGDGPPSEFYYDGRRMIAYAPQEGLAAVAEAPPTIDAMLRQAFDQAAIYFPFTDLIVGDPCRALTEELVLAFVVGQSRAVGGTTTDVIVLANRSVQGQFWIGAEDRLPRLIRATFFEDPAVFRHAVAFSDWQIDPAVPEGAFASAAAAQARPMAFARPDAPTRPAGAPPAPRPAAAPSR